MDLTLSRPHIICQSNISWIVYLANHSLNKVNSLKIKQTNKVNNTAYQQNVDLYYRGSMIPKTISPKTTFSAENSSMPNQESQNNSLAPSTGYHGGNSSPAPSQQQQSVPKNVFQCNIAVNMKNAQNFNEETAKH
ncbi:hypothetical protein Hanom_Chr06g00524721 [Helianthus anomalus]